MVSNLDNVDPREIEMLQQYLNEFGQQAEAYTAQLQILEQRRIESLTAIETIKNIGSQPDNTMLLEIGGGASMKVKALEPDNVFVNIGSNVIVEKTSDESVSYLEDRIIELEALEKKVSETITEIRKQASDVAKKMEDLYKKYQAQSGN
ncbi:prefoldin, alpha subunit [Methanolacinia petrolearia DSM 11571]|uniref:Prefoldin subunit alpha n=1 Tax=Methanolacinia petrolearia (strain DSM 11571 / OCM 486 / SEBR 4847) TaxID=679926 RepID=E1RIL2_METP4|nr:prefoldin subunit alpha [Methanolacinia petrolearia]ADN36604.1 prefoldin, alpha subunit [Methanolacinia petrolearia DSM 11571]